MKLFKYPRDYKESDEGMPMRPESIKPKQALFNKPESRKSRQYICNIYSLIYQRPVSAEVMERAAITECNEKLYGFVTDFVKHGIFSLNSIPAMPQYFGSDFLHGVYLDYDRRNNCLRFGNLDDTEEAQQFTREIAIFITHTIKEWMKKHEIWLEYTNEELRFQPRITKAFYDQEKRICFD